MVGRRDGVPGMVGWGTCTGWWDTLHTPVGVHIHQFYTFWQKYTVYMGPVSRIGREEEGQNREKQRE